MDRPRRLIILSFLLCSQIKCEIVLLQSLIMIFDAGPRRFVEMYITQTYYLTDFPDDFFLFFSLQNGRFVQDLPSFLDIIHERYYLE